MQERLIDLRSDTVTRPTPEMRQAMAQAEVGDDMSGEDPTVNRLEAMVAEMFGMEAAVYNCSGTQSNQMGLHAHCRPGDEILIHETSHIANYEQGGPAVLSGLMCRTLPGPRGMLDVPALDGKVRADDQHFPRTRLVCLENTTNTGGGRAYPLEQVERVGRWAHDHGLKVHVDGARLFNACVAQGYSPAEFARHVDSISVCFSKGLGCPMGSILIGESEFIREARRARKLFGGALRQAGIVAASAVYALQHHVDRLAEDHENARFLAEAIADTEGLMIDPSEVETNLVFFELDSQLGTAAQLSAALRDRGVLINPAGSQRLRACAHLDVDRKDIEAAVEVLQECVAEGFHDLMSAATGPYARG